MKLNELFTLFIVLRRIYYEIDSRNYVQCSINKQM